LLSLLSFLILFSLFSLFFFNETPPTEISTLSLHDALPIRDCARFFGRERCRRRERRSCTRSRLAARRLCSATRDAPSASRSRARSEEHTSELQSRFDLVCRLLLEKKKK